MSRLPTLGGDDGSWGSVLNDYLSQSLASDGTLQPNSVGGTQVASGSLTDAHLSGSAAISQSKIANLSNSLSAKAPLASPTFTGTVAGVTASMVGLGNVENKSSAQLAASTAMTNAFAALAPPPSGGDDTAVLQNLLNIAQQSGQKLILQAGTYNVTGLSTSQTVVQPTIEGQGMLRTVINVTAANPGITFVGYSGSASGGMISDLSIQGVSGSIGIEFQGCNFARAVRIKFTNIPIGGMFNNHASSTFTEECIFEQCFFESTVPVHLQYEVTGGAASFHGSGFKDCLFQQGSNDTASRILIGANCFVYNAPFDGQFFLNCSQPFISNASTQPCNTFGHIRIESGGNSTCQLFAPANGGGLWHHAGTVNALDAKSTLGSGFILASRIQTNLDGSITARVLPYETQIVLGAGSTSLLYLDQGCSVSVAMTIRNVQSGAYEYNCFLYANHYLDTSSGQGSATIIASSAAKDSNSLGAPTFSVVLIDGMYPYLVVTNSGFSSDFTAYMCISPLNSKTSYGFTS